MGSSPRVFALTVFFIVSLASASFAQKYEYIEYVVKPGDTLWDITKMELRDAFQWPMVWKENLKINNPDLIYPGQLIMVPVRLLPPETVEIAPPVKPGKPAPPLPKPKESRKVEKKPSAPPLKTTGLRVSKIWPLMNREAILESGYITMETPYEGEITGSAIGRTMFGLSDEIYVKTMGYTEAGTKFYVIRTEAKVKHPTTLKKIGYLVRVLGTVEVEEAGTVGLKATVTESFASMVNGDKLDFYYEIYPPLPSDKPRKPSVDAVIVASKYMKTLNGNFDIVFIDKGKKDDLREGDMLMTLHPGTDDRKNSMVQIVNLREKTSLGLIVESENAVRRGDIVEGMK